MIHLDISQTTFACFVIVGCVLHPYSWLCVRLSDFMPVVGFFWTFAFVSWTLGFVLNPHSWIEAGKVSSWLLVLLHHWDSCRIHTPGLRSVEWFHDVWFCWLWDSYRIYPSYATLSLVFSFPLCSHPVLMLWSFWWWCATHKYMHVRLWKDLWVSNFHVFSRSFDHWVWDGSMHAHGHLS